MCFVYLCSTSIFSTAIYKKSGLFQTFKHYIHNVVADLNTVGLVLCSLTAVGGIKNEDGIFQCKSQKNIYMNEK